MILSICDVPEVMKVMRIINIVVLIIRIVVPIILMISAMITLVRAVTNAELNKLTKPIVNKVIAAILIFLIPTLVRVVADISGNDREYEKCLRIVSKQEIADAFKSSIEEWVSKAEESKSVDDYNTALSYLNNLKDQNEKSSYQTRLDKVKEEIDKEREKQGGKIPSGTYPTTDSGELKIYYFGIGRFDGHLIIGNNTVLWIDGGYESTVRKVIPYIKNTLGITRIDALIGSHIHNNHIKAHIEMIKEFDVGAVYYGDDPGQCLSKKTCVQSASDPRALDKLIKEKNIPMTIMKPGLNQMIGGLNWDVVAPANLVTTGRYAENNNSLNMILKFGKNKFYFSGDHVRSSEILKSYSTDTLDVDIFKWPHHGQESVDKKFLDALSPQYIIVPNGRAQGSSNSGISYSKAKGYATGTDGYVLAVSDGTNLTVTQVNKR